MATRTPVLTNRQKAATIMVALGPDIAGQIMKEFTEPEVDMMTLEIARMGTVTSETRVEIVDEFYNLCLAQEYIAEGGLDAAKQTLEAAFGLDNARSIVGRVLQSMETEPFEFVKRADAGQVITFIQHEHPQTIALILAYLQPSQAALILSGLPHELRADVARRIATLDKTAPDVVREVERVLERKLSVVVAQDFSAAGGVKQLVQVLNWVDRSTEKTILESLTENSPAIAEQVKKMMFVFEDINMLDDRSIQQVLKEIDMKELSIALKGVGEAVQQRIFKNMSERAAAMLKEDMEFMGPVRLRAVEEAQQKVVNVIRKLEEAGEITISRGGGEDMVA